MGAGRPAWCRRVQVPELTGSTPASARRKTMHIKLSKRRSSNVEK
nr:MAG TPA: hypothetical protein [Caudoviricetes sp.]